MIQTAAPNQKVITIRREKPEKPFLLASFESICNAAQHLNGNKASAFMIWVYCVHNQDGFILEISHKLLEECFGMKKRSYDLAIRSLIEDEFLVKKSRQHYDFIEYPEAHKSSKSADTAHLKVPDKHIQKCHNSTFKSANMAQDNNIRQDKDNIIKKETQQTHGQICDLTETDPSQWDQADTWQGPVAELLEYIQDVGFDNDGIDNIGALLAKAIRYSIPVEEIKNMVDNALEMENPQGYLIQAINNRTH